MIDLFQYFAFHFVPWPKSSRFHFFKLPNCLLCIQLLQVNFCHFVSLTMSKQECVCVLSVISPDNPTCFTFLRASSSFIIVWRYQCDKTAWDFIHLRKTLDIICSILGRKLEVIGFIDANKGNRTVTSEVRHSYVIFNKVTFM